jgi:hypothetical protein
MYYALLNSVTVALSRLIVFLLTVYMFFMYNIKINNNVNKTAKFFSCYSHIVLETITNNL